MSGRGDQDGPRPPLPADDLRPDIQRPPAEVLHAAELEALAAADEAPRPPGWRLSPQAVRRFVLGDPESGVVRKFVLTGMREGKVVRFEEIARCPVAGAGPAPARPADRGRPRSARRPHAARLDALARALRDAAGGADRDPGPELAFFTARSAAGA